MIVVLQHFSYHLILFSYDLIYSIFIFFQKKKKPPPLKKFTSVYGVHRAYDSLMSMKAIHIKGSCIIYGKSLKHTKVTKTESDGSTHVRESVHKIALLSKCDTISLTSPASSFSKYESSHLCGKNTCIRKSHIVWESHAVNKQRQSCHREGRRLGRRHCFGNHGEGVEHCL